MKNIGICYYANALKEEKKEHKYTTQKTFMKLHIVQQTIHELWHNISREFNFWSTRNWMGSLNDESKLQVDEKNNKTEKFENPLKICNIIKFKTVRYKLTSLSNIFHSIINCKFLEWSEFYGYLKN